MKRAARAGLLAISVAAAVAVAAPAHADDIVITQFGIAFAGNPFAIGIDRGDFKKAGVDLTGIISGAGGGTSVRNVMASELGYGEVVLSAAIAAIQEGQDIKVVNVGARSVADVVVVVKPESTIRSLKDLEGKKIGFSNPKSLSEILAIMAIERGGLKAEQATRVALGSLGGALTALEKGGVDAAITMQLVWAQRADKLRVILDAGRDLPPMVQSVGIATAKLMKEKPEKLRAILAARREAVKFMNAEPEQAAKMLEKHFAKVPPDVLAKVTVMLAKGGYWSEGKLEREPMENMARGLKLVGDIKGDVDWAKITDPSFLPKDLQ